MKAFPDKYLCGFIDMRVYMMVTEGWENEELRYRLTVWEDLTGGSPDDAVSVVSVQNIGQQSSWVMQTFDTPLPPLDSGHYLVGVEFLEDNMSQGCFNWVEIDDSVGTNDNSWSCCENQGGCKTLED
jgi:hypothetical protein